MTNSRQHTPRRHPRVNPDVRIYSTAALSQFLGGQAEKTLLTVVNASSAKSGYSDHKSLREPQRAPLPPVLPGKLFLFSPFLRSTRKLIPRFTVVRVLVDPIEQLLAAWLLAPTRLSFRFADHEVRGRFAVKNGNRQIEWRCGALLRSFGWATRISFNAEDDLCETMLVLRCSCAESQLTPAHLGSCS